MNAEQLIKRHILIEGFKKNNPEESAFIPDVVDESNVDDVYDEFLETIDAYQDFEYEFRECGIDTDVEAPRSRHYESKSKAYQLPCGQWVGWTYWYGGGKHGEPESIEWMAYAYLLDVSEEQKVVTVRTFKVITQEEQQ